MRIKPIDIFIVAATVLFCSLCWLTGAWGEDYTVAWDAAKMKIDGSNCTDCRYYLYLRHRETGLVYEEGDVAELSATLTPPDSDSYTPGVAAYLTSVVEGFEIIDTSDITWADDPNVCVNGQTFLIGTVYAPIMGSTSMGVSKK